MQTRQQHQNPARKLPRKSEAGLTLVELIVTVAILGILASAAVPIARFKVQRNQHGKIEPSVSRLPDAYRLPRNVRRHDFSPMRFSGTQTGHDVAKPL